MSIARIAMDSPSLTPALILSYGAVPDPSVPQDSFPGGTAFFISADFLATARHIGEIIRTEFAQAHMRERDGRQPYDM